MLALDFIPAFVLFIFIVLFIAQGVSNREIEVAAFEVAGEAFVEDDEFRAIGTASGILGPIRGNLAREGGVAGKDQDGRAMHAHWSLSGSASWPQGCLISP